jgi:cell division inhibitor SepF
MPDLRVVAGFARDHCGKDRAAPPVTICTEMGFADLWNRTLVYFGIAEEDDYWDEDGYTTNEELERTYTARERANVRRLPRRQREEYEEWSDSDAAAAQTQVARPRATREPAAAPAGRPRRLEAAPSPNVKVHLVLPRSFNDAQQIADKFKEAVPVILNLQTTDQELSKRLIDFASGLTYALNGGMQRVADKVFLLTPRNVEVSAEERARLLERGGFFNQA